MNEQAPSFLRYSERNVIFETEIPKRLFV